MTLKERIAYAEGRRDEAIANGGDVTYWRGYVQGLITHLGDLLIEDEREARKQKEEEKNGNKN